jgi:hypothetical protein
MNFFKNVYTYIITFFRNLGKNKNKDNGMKSNTKPLKIIVPITRKNKYSGFYEEDDDEIIELNSLIKG